MPGEPQGQAAEPTKSAWIRPAGHGPARVPGWLVGRLRLGVGHARTVRPDPSTLGDARIDQVGGVRNSWCRGWSAAKTSRAM